MFLDRFDFRATAIDGEPCKPEESIDITFWSSGKVEMSRNGQPEEIRKDAVVQFAASLGIYYGITPEEFAAAVEKEKASRAQQTQKYAFMPTTELNPCKSAKGHCFHRVDHPGKVGEQTESYQFHEDFACCWCGLPKCVVGTNTHGPFFPNITVLRYY